MYKGEIKKTDDRVVINSNTERYENVLRWWALKLAVKSRFVMQEGCRDGPYNYVLDSGHVSLLHSVGSSLQSLSRVQLFASPWTVAHWAPLSFTTGPVSKLFTSGGQSIGVSASTSDYIAQSEIKIIITKNIQI